MSVQTPPGGPYLVRAAGAIYLTASYPNTSNGRVAFRGALVKFDEERRGYQVRSYVVAGRPDDWFDFDGRGVSIGTPRLNLPPEFRATPDADGLRVAA